MLKCINLLCITLHSFVLFSQESIQAGKWNITLEYKNKLDKSKNTVANAESINTVENLVRVHAGSLLLNYTCNKYFDIQSGLCVEPFQRGWALYTSKTSISERSDYYLLALIIPLRITYKQHLFKVFKRNLSLEPSVGLLNGIRLTNGDFGSHNSGSTTTNSAFSLVSREEVGQEFGIRNIFFLADARAAAVYQLNRSFSIVLGGGYSKGTSTIGRVNVTYIRSSDMITRYIKKDLKGDNMYVNLGIRLNLIK